MTFRVEHELATALAGALVTLEGVTGCGTCDACRGAAALRVRAIRESLSMEAAAALAGCIPGANAMLDRLATFGASNEGAKMDQLADLARQEC